MLNSKDHAIFSEIHLLFPTTSRESRTWKYMFVALHQSLLSHIPDLENGLVQLSFEPVDPTKFQYILTTFRT